MGTRGFTGFVIDGVEKMGYQQYDSYPDGVGTQVLAWLHTLNEETWPEARERARALEVVQTGSEPTAEQIAKLRRFHDGGVSTGALQEWYSLLRATQGRPDLILEAGVVEDSSTFAYDSLFCEYGYLIDFDQEVLEVYQGFQRQPPTQGRWSTPERLAASVERARDAGSIANEYHAVQLVGSWPLLNLPTEEEFLAALAEDEEVDA